MEIIMWIRVYNNWKMNFNFKNGTKTSFSYETKASKYFTQRGECDYGAQSWKEWWLFCEFMFIPIERQTPILKMVEIEVSPSKPKHQYHLSQWGECVYGTQS